ncbi:hypothetical protein AAFF_G00170540 [Aldrovandia affinis]|uniref:Uncharacterized protein n=1 Tax=Aldrovandia affinis TaxID=143900 RepID=A0AAD7VWS5_9TELE|nr:hypothetical protein AAFF_G00170540 [Aldrovandia affinis]
MPFVRDANLAPLETMSGVEKAAIPPTLPLLLLLSPAPVKDTAPAPDAVPLLFWLRFGFGVRCGSWSGPSSWSGCSSGSKGYANVPGGGRARAPLRLLQRVPPGGGQSRHWTRRTHRSGASLRSRWVLARVGWSTKEGRGPCLGGREARGPKEAPSIPTDPNPLVLAGAVGVTDYCTRMDLELASRYLTRAPGMRTASWTARAGF